MNPIATFANTFAGTLPAEPQFLEMLTIAIEGLKTRLQERYEIRFPGQGRLISRAIADAEAAAWETPFPQLVLPDLVELKLDRLADGRALCHREKALTFACAA